MDYLNPPYSVSVQPLWWHKQGLQQTASGYGKKLTTEYVVTVPGERPRRVYATCFSNVASFYIFRKGQTVWLHDYDLEAAR